MYWLHGSLHHQTSYPKRLRFVVLSSWTYHHSEHLISALAVIFFKFPLSLVCVCVSIRDCGFGSESMPRSHGKSSSHSKDLIANSMFISKNFSGCRFYPLAQVDSSVNFHPVQKKSSISLEGFDSSNFTAVVPYQRMKSIPMYEHPLNVPTLGLSSVDVDPNIIGNGWEDDFFFLLLH